MEKSFNMDKNKIIDVVENSEHKSNNELLETLNILLDEYTKTKELIINLTKHLDIIEEYYNIVNKEIGKRLT